MTNKSNEDERKAEIIFINHMINANNAIKVNPNNEYEYNNRGNAYYIKKEYDNAIADFTQAIRINPNYAEAYLGRGMAYYNKNNYDCAIANYSEAIKINSNDEFAYLGRGRAYYDKNNYDCAIADYSEAIRINPDDKCAYINRGRAYHNKKDYDNAKKDIVKVLSIDPNNNEAKNLLKQIQKNDFWGTISAILFGVGVVWYLIYIVFHVFGPETSELKSDILRLSDENTAVFFIDNCFTVNQINGHKINKRWWDITSFSKKSKYMILPYGKNYIVSDFKKETTNGSTTTTTTAYNLIIEGLFDKGNGYVLHYVMYYDRANNNKITWRISKMSDVDFEKWKKKTGYMKKGGK